MKQFNVVITFPNKHCKKTIEKLIKTLFNADVIDHFVVPVDETLYYNQVVEDGVMTVTFTNKTVTIAIKYRTSAPLEVKKDLIKAMVSYVFRVNAKDIKIETG